MSAPVGRPGWPTTSSTPTHATAAGRTVSARLALPGPQQRDAGTRWAVRRTDLDPFGHVNNAATWAFLEEAAALDAADRASVGPRWSISNPSSSTRPGSNLVTQVDGSATTAWLVSGTSVRAAGRWSAADD